MKSRSLVAVTGAVLVLILVVGGMIVAFQPLIPGAWGYGVQQALTDFGVSLVFDPVRRTGWQIALAEKRLDDYVSLDGSEDAH